MSAKHIYILSLILCAALPLPAHGDSYCGYDKGLIGTKAVGHISPYQIETESSDDAQSCIVNIYHAPGDEAPSSTRPCVDFVHMPSPYLGNAKDGTLNPMGDYFSFLAYKEDGAFAQIKLNSGETKWVKNKHAQPFNLPYFYSEDGISSAPQGEHPTQSMVFVEPRLDKPDYYFGTYNRGLNKYWIDGEVSPAFFTHDIFDHLEKIGVFNSADIEKGELGKYTELLEITYQVKSIVKDDDGREWLEAQEFLSLRSSWLEDRVENLLRKQDKELSEEDRLSLREMSQETIKSGPARTIYIPYREPSGTITMVMSDGPDCGC